MTAAGVDPSRLHIGQRIRVTTRPPRPATIVGTVTSIVPDGQGGYAVEVSTKSGGRATAFSSLFDRLEVLR